MAASTWATGSDVMCFNAAISASERGEYAHMICKSLIRRPTALVWGEER